MKLRAGEWVVLAGTLFIVGFALLVGTLIWLKPPPARYAYAASAAAEQGEVVYRREACRDCHKVFGNGSSSGPALDGVGARRSPEWLQAYLVNPRPLLGERAYRVTMPSYAGLKPAERDALVAYLSALAAPAAQRHSVGLVGLVLLVQPGAYAGPGNDGQCHAAANAEDEQYNPRRQFEFDHDVGQFFLRS